MQVAGYGQHTNNTIPSAIRWALVERLNRTLINMLSLAVTDQQASWENHFPTVCMAYNTSVQATTRHTLFFLMFGRQARLPVDIMFGSPMPVPTPTTDYVQNLKETLEKSYQLASSVRRISMTNTFMVTRTNPAILCGYTVQLSQKDALRSSIDHGRDLFE